MFSFFDLKMSDHDLPYVLHLMVERDSQLGGENGNVEDMLLSMLNERDRLMVGLKEAREELQATQLRLRDLERERDNLQVQLTSTIPAVGILF
nr:liprin alpha 2 [Hymenolepis microstoma]